MIIETVKDAQLIGEGTAEHANKLTRLQAPIEADHLILPQQILQGFNDAGGDCAGQASTHDEGDDAEGPVDAPPAIARQIEGDEDVARKERRDGRPKLPRVADCLQAKGEEAQKLLPRKVGDNSPLGVGPRIGYKPLAPPKIAHVPIPVAHPSTSDKHLNSQRIS